MTYEKACSILRYRTSNDLSANKKLASSFLKTASIKTPLRLKAAATFILRK